MKQLTRRCLFLPEFTQTPQICEYKLTKAEHLHLKLANFRSWFPPFRSPACYMDRELEALVNGRRPSRYKAID